MSKIEFIGWSLFCYTWGVVLTRWSLRHALAKLKAIERYGESL